MGYAPNRGVESAVNFPSVNMTDNVSQKQTLTQRLFIIMFSIHCLPQPKIRTKRYCCVLVIL